MGPLIVCCSCLNFHSHVSTNHRQRTERHRATSSISQPSLERGKKTSLGRAAKEDFCLLVLSRLSPLHAFTNLVTIAREAAGWSSLKMTVLHGRT